MGVCKRCDSKGVGSDLGNGEEKERIYTEFAEGMERVWCHGGWLVEPRSGQPAGEVELRGQESSL
jgi:hypothetical protein